MFLMGGLHLLMLEFLLQVNPASAGIQYDREFVVCALDLLSGLVEGLGSGVESLVITLSMLFVDH